MCYCVKFNNNNNIPNSTIIVIRFLFTKTSRHTQYDYGNLVDVFVSLLSYINISLNQKQKTSPPIQCNGQIFIHPTDKAETFNEYVCSTSHHEPETSYCTTRTQSSIERITVTELGVIDRLKLLNPSNPCGPDNFSPKMLKHISNSIAKPLTKLFNFSLTNVSGSALMLRQFITAR